MSSLEDLEQRMATMEAELAVVRQEAAAARALAAGADRDVAEYRAELRGHTRLLTALRETQVRHYAEHKADTAEIKAGIAPRSATSWADFSTETMVAPKVARASSCAHSCRDSYTHS